MRDPACPVRTSARLFPVQQMAKWLAYGNGALLFRAVIINKTAIIPRIFESARRSILSRVCAPVFDLFRRKAPAGQRVLLPAPGVLLHLGR